VVSPPLRHRVNHPVTERPKALVASGEHADRKICAQTLDRRHPLDVPVFVVTHQASPEWVSEGSPFTFVSDGLESAVAQAKAAAGDKDVGVIGANLVQQCIKAGLLDEIHLDMVPVVLGGGVGLFDHLGTGPIELESTQVIEGAGITHLTFRVV
jgi:dihydrofolate reductase